MIMIVKLEKEEFDAVFSIMERSFPLEEFRPYDAQTALLSDSAYTIYVAKEKGKILGFAAVWDLENWLFLEHLAVEPACRDRGIGAELLHFLAEKQCCLEVEPPVTELTRRRVGFYQRNGFFLNDYPYVQPSLGDGRSPVPLHIMTTGNTVSPEEFSKLKALLYSRVYGRKE